MRLVTFLFLITITGVIFPQERTETEIILDKIYLNLERLETDILVKLNRRDYKRAEVLLKNIYTLLETLREPEVYAMDDKSFRDLMITIKNESFSTNRLDIMKTAAASNYFTVYQLTELVKILTYTDERIGAVELIYPWVIDKKNAYQIYTALTYSSEKEEVRKIIDRYN